MKKDNSDSKKSFVTVRVPGSKSLSQRALVTAALAKGDSVIRNVLVSQDTRYMMDALGNLGAKITESEDGFLVSG